MNKSATQSGLVTAQEQFQYRATHDATFDGGHYERGRKPLTYPPPTVVYGVPTKYVYLDYRYSVVI